MTTSTLPGQRLALATALLILGTLVSNPTVAASPTMCSMRLIAELTPDVPDARDPGFLSSLLSNQTAYQLRWVGRAGASTVVVDLIGPGPETQCQRVLKSIRRDGRVLAVHNSVDDMPTLAIQADRTPATDDPATFSVSPYGFGAVYQAMRHRADAWKIALPVSGNSTDF